MHRRTFLKLLAQTSLAAVAGFAGRSGMAASNLEHEGVQAVARGRLLRGTSHGLILESLDGGQNWRRIADFGTHCSVDEIVQRPGYMLARIGVQGFGFNLRSRDGRAWHTLDASSWAA